jgi:hypothetical protein
MNPRVEWIKAPNCRSHSSNAANFILDMNKAAYCTYFSISGIQSWVFEWRTSAGFKKVAHFGPVVFAG